MNPNKNSQHGERQCPIQCYHSLRPLTPIHRMKDHWVTGLTGVADHQYPKAGFDGLHRPLHKGDPWTIRWDYDEIKGSHVNLEWGPRPQSKIAFKAPPPPGGHGQRAAYYLDAIKDMTAFLGYRHHGAGTPGQRIHPNAGPSGNARLIEEDKWLHAAAIELANKWEALYAPQPVYHSTQKQH